MRENSSRSRGRRRWRSDRRYVRPTSNATVLRDIIIEVEYFRVARRLSQSDATGKCHGLLHYFVFLSLPPIEWCSFYTLSGTLFFFCPKHWFMFLILSNMTDLGENVGAHTTILRWSSTLRCCAIASVFTNGVIDDIRHLSLTPPPR